MMDGYKVYNFRMCAYDRHVNFLKDNGFGKGIEIIAKDIDDVNNYIPDIISLGYLSEYYVDTDLHYYSTTGFGDQLLKQI